MPTDLVMVNIGCAIVQNALEMMILIHTSCVMNIIDAKHMEFIGRNFEDKTAWGVKSG
ncbi:hypothetical protein ACTHO0_13245 [Cytobacillus praedii]